MERKIYESTAGCGYNECAYVIPISQTEDGNINCLVLDSNEREPIHKQFEIIELERFYLEETPLKIKDFGFLEKNYLFLHFISTTKEIII